MTNVSGTSQNNSFFGKIGQAFKKGWNNGNLAKGITALGATGFTVGLTGAMIHDANNNRCSCGNNSIWFGMLGTGLNYRAGMDLLNFSAYQMPGMYPGITSGNSMLYPRIMQLDPNWGTKYMQNWEAEYMKKMQPLTYENPAAEKWAANQSTEAGKQFNQNTSALIDNKTKKPIEGNEYTFSTKPENYKDDVSNLAKSFAAYIESKGNTTQDQKLTLEEYINYELSNLPEDATDEEKQKTKVAATNAFINMDLNGDDSVDWKEVAATIATLDSDNEGNLDGKIESEQYAQWSTYLASDAQTSKTTRFKQILQKTYKQLFGSDE